MSEMLFSATFSKCSVKEKKKRTTRELINEIASINLPVLKDIYAN